jgi:pseudaminic acid cytidylyltransferase
MNVAIIPARGGSKRIPGKNIKSFAGKPIISYSIEAARDCGLFDRIIVSTDSEEIAAVATQRGAEAPFLRPAEIADDLTPTAPVLAHALNWLAQDGASSDYACCIYPTAPFITAEYLRQGFEELTRNNVSSVISVTTFSFPIFRAFERSEKGNLEMIWPEHELTRSNDLPDAYHDAGQFYWLDTKIFLEEGKMYGRDARPVILPRYLVQDIDSPEDWETAERMFKALDARDSK